MKNIQVWYHGHCDDGFGAAWAAYTHFAKTDRQHQVKFTPVYYNKPYPEIHEDDVIYILDFSYPREVLLELQTKVRRVYVIDHHKTAQAALKGLPDCIFDMEQSGAVLAWKFFHGHEPVPLLLKYVQANDLWKHDTLPHTKAVVRYIRTKSHSFNNWIHLHREFEINFSKILDRAESVEEYFQNQLRFNMDHAKTIIWTVQDNNEFVQYICPVINCSPTFASEICHELLNKHKTKIAMSYFIDNEGLVNVSIRGSGEVDVSAIAKKYGGGGHNNAAGFKITPVTFFAKINAINHGEQNV